MNTFTSLAYRELSDWLNCSQLRPCDVMRGHKKILLHFKGTQAQNRLGTTGLKYSCGVGGGVWHKEDHPGSCLKKKNWSIKASWNRPRKQVTGHSTSSTYLYRVVRHRCSCCSVVSQFAVYRQPVHMWYLTPTYCLLSTTMKLNDY